MEWSKIVAITIDFFRACESHECMSVSSANILPFPIHESIFSADVTSPLPSLFHFLFSQTICHKCMRAHAHMHVCIHLLRGKLFYGLVDVIATRQ